MWITSRFYFEAGNHERAGLLTGAFEAARESLGAVWGPEMVGIDSGGTRLRKALGEEAAERLIAPGRDLSIEEAVELGMSS